MPPCPRAARVTPLPRGADRAPARPCPPSGTPRCPPRPGAAMAPGRPLALASLLALAAAAATAAATDAGTSWSAVPRRTVPYAELQDAAKRFSQGGVSHYLTLTLDEAEGLLYVGAREAVFALATGTVELKAAISWEAPVEKKAECVQKGKNNQTDCFNYVRFLQSYNSSHLYACGTYAFQPKCTYIELSGFTLDPVAFEDGKGKCPYDPTKGHTGLIVDGELYSATFNNFLGTEPVILRNLGPHYSMKTEYLTSWLNEPHFVASAFVPESAGSGDDDKVYFFFSERAVEYDCYAEQVVARVARVCKGDVGGARTLQKKWTSFLKARLLCSAPEQQLHFNRLQAVFTLPGARWQDTAFFGVFRARWGDVDVSAICRYHILEVRKAFEGPYKEYREQAQKWGRYSGEVPSPRPGACITDWHRQNGFASSLELPDNTLNFAKKHPLMDEPVPPQRGRPLLLKKDANFTQLVVDRVAGLDGATYEVLFIGTGDGWVHKALDLGTHIHLVEELQVFEPAQPVESLALAGTKVSGAGLAVPPRRQPAASPQRCPPAPGRSCCSPGPACRWHSCPWPTAGATSPAPTASWHGTPTAPGAATAAPASAPTATTGTGHRGHRGHWERLELGQGGSGWILGKVLPPEGAGHGPEAAPGAFGQRCQGCPGWDFGVSVQGQGLGQGSQWVPPRSGPWGGDTTRTPLTVPSSRSSHLVQDVLSSDTGACSVPQVAKQGPLTPKNVTVVAGTDLVLTCRLGSNLARALWTFEGRALAAEQVLVLGEARLRALVVPGAGAQHSGTYRCLAEEQGARLAAQEYRVAVLAGPGAPLETRAPLESLGVVWVLAVCLGALCLLLLLAVLSLWRRLRQELGKGAKAIESTLVYPIELPKEPPSPRFVSSAASDSDEKLWDPSSYYYSDGSLKIVPGHASTAGSACCRNGGPGAASPPAAIPGQPLHSPTRIHLGPLRGSASNGYIRLALGAEERPACADLAEELRRKLQQRQPLPDSNPEESSV
ncbi:semaphorin-4C isoform 3-T3 [Cyanocitta cristata]